MSEKNEDQNLNITVFGPETEFDGVLEFTDNLVITGKFKGKIVAPSGNLEIAKNAYCDVESIKTSSIVISGNVKGKIDASDRVEICSGSTVDGDVSTAHIRVSNNVEFNGQVTMLDKKLDVDLFSVASDEFKQAMIVHSDIVN